MILTCFLVVCSSTKETGSAACSCFGALFNNRIRILSKRTVYLFDRIWCPGKPVVRVYRVGAKARRWDSVGDLALGSRASGGNPMRASDTLLGNKSSGRADQGQIQHLHLRPATACNLKLNFNLQPVSESRAKHGPVY